MVGGHPATADLYRRMKRRGAYRSVYPMTLAAAAGHSFLCLDFAIGRPITCGRNAMFRKILAYNGWGVTQFVLGHANPLWRHLIASLF